MSTTIRSCWFGSLFFVTVFCFSGTAYAAVYTPDDMLVVTGFTVEITGAGTGCDSNSAWETVRGGSLNIATARSRYSNHAVKSPALGRTALPALPIPRLRSGTRSPSPHTRWKRMRSKALIQGKRMFLVNPIGKKHMAPTGTYKLNNGKFVTVRNGRILPKTGCP